MHQGSTTAIPPPLPGGGGRVGFRDLKEALWGADVPGKALGEGLDEGAARLAGEGGVGDPLAEVEAPAAGRGPSAPQQTKSQC